MRRYGGWIWCPRADDGSQRALFDSVRLGVLKYVFFPYLKCIRMVWEKQEGTGQMLIGDVVKCILLRPQLTFDLYPYASQRPEAPQGSTSPVLVTGSPISCDSTFPW